MNPFSIDHRKIKSLGPDKLVGLLGRLIHQSAFEANVPLESIRVPGDIYTKDQGIDAHIDYPVPPGISWLPEGISGWQSKAEELDKNKASRTPYARKGARKLSPGVIKLLDNGGTYVLVCGKKDPPNTDEWAEAIRDEFGKHGYPDGKALVYGAGQIAQWAQQHPGLALDLNPALSLGKSHNRWSRQKDIRDIPFTPDETRKDFIKKIQAHILADSRQSPIIRILGHTGIGKSRLVFEALNNNRFRESVVYVPDTGNVDLPLITYLGEGRWQQAILVVDDCPHDSHRKLATLVTEYGSKIALVTLYPETAEYSTSGELLLRVESLDSDASSSLLDSLNPELPDEIKNRIVDVAQGYPQILYLLAENLQQDRDIYSPELLANTGVSQMMDRILNGRRAPDSDVVVKTKRLLTALSLFDKLGWSGDLQAEGEAVCGVLGIPWNEACEILSTEANRGLVRVMGRLRAVTPLPLIIYLAAQWWDTYSCADTLRLINALPFDHSGNRFFSRMRMMGTVAGARECAEQLLLSDDFFRGRFALETEYGSHFFYELAHVHPEAAFYRLRQELGNKSREELIQFKSGRRYVMFALEKLARWPNIFPGVSRLVLRLADSETENHISNNASGVWLGFFQPFLSGTPASLSERMLLIKEALTSESPQVRELAIEALGKVLTHNHLSRSGASDDQGAFSPPLEWRPKIYKELWDPMKEALGLLLDIVNAASGNRAKRAREIIASKSLSLINIGLVREAIGALEQLWQTLQEPTEELVTTVGDILRHEGNSLEPKYKDRLKALNEAFKGQDFHGKLRRFAGMPYGFGDDDFKDWKDYHKYVSNQLAQLASIALDNTTTLEPELQWLLSEDAKSSLSFGLELARADRTNTLLKKLWQETVATEGATSGLICGYVMGLAERDAPLVDDFLEQLAQSERGRKHFIQLCWRFEPTPRVLANILIGLRENWIEPAHLNTIGMGRLIDGLTQEEIAKFLHQILEINAKTAPALIQTLSLYFHDKKVLKHHKMIRFLTDLLTTLNVKDSDNWDVQHTSYCWRDLSVLLLEQSPQSAHRLAVYIIRSLEASSAVYFEPYFRSALANCMKIDDRGVGEILLNALSEEKTIGHRLANMLSETPHWDDRKGVIDIVSMIPEELLWQHCEQSPEKMPYLLANAIPLHGSSELNPLAKELLVRYGHVKEVGHALSGHLITGGWSGRRSDHYKKKLERVAGWLNPDDHPNVKAWVNGEISRLKARIKEAMNEEAERDW